MATTRTTAPVDQTTAVYSSSGWRVVDIVVAAVLGIAVGLVFIAFNYSGAALFDPLSAILPGLGGLIVGVWLLGGPLGGLVIRKPGAATLVEVLAASVSVLPGNQWGLTTLWSGLAQGLGAEIVFAIFLYRRWNLPVAMLAGAGAGIGAWLLEFTVFGNHAKSFGFNITYLVCLAISGAVLAGGLAWLLTRALAGTGVLSRFASGRSEA